MKHLRKYIKIFRNRNILAAISTLFCLAVSFSANSAAKSDSYEKYIRRYKAVAVEHRDRYGIPASITLAQGLLESGAGRSVLAKQANNHFGIKCGRSWKGKCYYHDDDAKDECFRVYKNAAESYGDHAAFLRQKRYSRLFDLKITDYKGWAKGLKKCGYATDPKYPEKLIALIEKYELYRYDKVKSGDIKREKDLSDVPEIDKAEDEIPEITNPHEITQTNGLDCIIARDGDTFAKLGTEFGIKARHLAGYNDIADSSENPKPGDIVYIQKKHKKVDKSCEKYHVVKPGDTLQALSQLYGIRLSSLCSMNRLRASSVPIPGKKLKLR